MKVAMYMDEHQFGDHLDSSTYVYNGLKDHFDVALCFEPNPLFAHDADVVFCRFDIPVKTEFLQQLAVYNDKLFVNPPATKLRYHTKHYLTSFPHLTPPTMISQNPEEIARFAQQHGKVVLKPVNENGGKGVISIDAYDRSAADLQEQIYDYLTNNGTTVAQEYIEGVEKFGDKRINIIGYEPVTASLRLPPDGSFICNMSFGGSYHPAEITDTDHQIIQGVLPFLREQGVFWAGIDIIGPYLGEVNVACPGMLLEGDIINDTTQGIDTLVQKLEAYGRQRDAA